MMLLATIPPQLIEQRRRKRELLRYVLPALLLLASMQAPLDDYLPAIIQRLDPTFLGFCFRGKDVFVTFENQRYFVWLNTGELQETLLDITFSISGDLVLLNRRGWGGGGGEGEEGNWGECKLNCVNKLLLTLMWLRKYPCIATLELIFDVSPSKVSAIMHTVLFQFCGDFWKPGFLAKHCRVECFTRHLALISRCSREYRRHAP